MTPLDLFVGRLDEIQTFENLIEPGSTRWVMLVSGPSGTGKSLLIDWLFEKCCREVRHARVQLTPNTTPWDFLRLLAVQLGREYAKALGEKLDELERAERQAVQINVAPTMKMEGKLAGRISGATQTSNTTVHLGSVAEIEQLEREGRRLDAFVKVLEPLGLDSWVLFVDEAEHLKERGQFTRFLLDRLVRRLRSHFPGFRLYLSGQALPDRASFPRHECVNFELGTLKPSEAALFLERAGITDEAVKTKLIQLTSAYPLLLGMIIEGPGLDASDLNQLDGRKLTDRLDPRAVTAWIYDRIIDRLPESIRPIAVDLSLFDWFDLTILRASFGIELEDAVFRDLIRRSFVKQIGAGQWRCHDIVRQHLAAERRDSDPEVVVTVSRKAFQAFIEQMLARGERDGDAFFAGRLDYVRGALTSASEFSANKALSFVTDEFLKASTDSTIDYLFGLTRMMDAASLPASVREFGCDSRCFLERYHLDQSDKNSLDFALRLASEAQRLKNEEASELFRGLALHLAWKCREWETALRLAGELIEERPTVENKIERAIIQAEAGSADEGRRMLESIRDEEGDTVEVLTGLGMFALIVDETDQAQRHFTDAVAGAPEGAEEARLQLAQILFMTEQYEEALVQVDRLLEIAPEHQVALRLRLEILACLGRFRHVSPSGQEDAIFRDFKDMFAELSTESAEGLVMTELAEDSSAVPLPVLLGQGAIFALRGNQEAQERIHAAVLERAPEARDLVELQRVELLIVTTRPQLAVERAERLLKRRPDWPGAYFALSKIHEMLGHSLEARRVLDRVTEAFPSLQDFADQAIAATWLIENNLKGALDYLEQRAEESDLGPQSRLLQARLLAAEHRPDRALDILEHIIVTADREELSTSDMILARRLFGIISAAAAKTEQARSTAENLTELFPHNPAAIVAAITIYVAIGDERPVRSMSRTYGDDAPLIVRSALLEALATFELKRYGGDLDELLAALKNDPRRLELVMATMVASSQIPPEQSISLIARVFELAPNAVLEIQRLFTHTMVADFATREKVMSMRKAPSTPPHLRLGLTAVLAGQGYIDLQDGCQELRDIGNEFPQLATNSKMLEIELLLNVGKVDEVGAMLAPHMELDRMTELALPMVIRYLTQKGDRQGAVRCLKRAADTNPARRRILLEMMVDILIDYDASQALNIIQELEPEAPLSIGLSMSRANALGSLERYDEAIATMNEVLKDEQLDTGDRATCMAILAKWRLKAGHTDAAIQSYRDALDLEPDSAPVLTGLSIALEKAQQWPEAYSTLRDAIALEPKRINTAEKRLQLLRARAIESEAKL